MSDSSSDAPDNAGPGIGSGHARRRAVFKGRGAVGQPVGRFARSESLTTDDGWGVDPDADSGAPPTELLRDNARTIIARNTSPDLPFSQSINPYKGCEHGCIYCFARQTHSYLDLSPGIDFETKIFFKPEAASLLEAELGKPGYVCSTIAMGTNTDPYQPAEKQLEVTRAVLEVLWRHRHPVSIVTKSSLILRDLDILSDMAAVGLASAAVSVTTLDNDLKRRLEPRTASPAKRLATLDSLVAAGIPTSAMVAPVIPTLNDSELEAILEAVRERGVRRASYILIRLPLEVAGLFRDWLTEHYPLRADHVMSLIQATRGGRDYNSSFGQRQAGTGIVADLIGQRFRTACRRLGLNEEEPAPLDTGQFRRPNEQFSLFG